MDDAPDFELAALQQRAYGRSSDIHHDPAALARLHTLETRLASPIPPPASEFDTTSTNKDEAVLTTGDRSAVPSSMRTRRVAVLWVASIMVTALITAVAIAGIGSRTSSQEIAALPLSTDVNVPGWVDGTPNGATATDDFVGLTIIKQPGDTSSGTDGETCIYVFPTITTDNGNIYTGCTAGTFPATAQLTVSPTLPTPLRAAFSDGTGLQFTLDANTIRIHTDPR